MDRGDQETVTKIIPKKKNCKKGKCQNGLQIAEKRREVKSKGERQRYTQLNAEFQGTARRDKKDFFNKQCKQIEETSRIGKTRDLFKKTGDTEGTLFAKMGTIKTEIART